MRMMQWVKPQLQRKKESGYIRSDWAIPMEYPFLSGPGSNSNRRDKDGQVVVSKLNEKLLMEVAAAGNGAYIAGDRINSLEDELNKLQKRDLNTKVFSEFAERFQYFAGFALLFLVLEFIIRSRKNPLLKRYNLFKTSEDEK